MKTLPLTREIDLPLDAITQKFDIMGQSGGGKTYLAMRLAELMLEAGGQIVVIDTVGPWWGLRSSADGKKPGYQILVVGGLHGDLALSPSAGAEVANLVVDTGVSVILDVSQMLENEMYRFVADFLARFFHKKKNHQSPVHLFFEECQEIIPETTNSSLQQACRAVAIRIMKIGRNYGIGWSAITQEPQAASKRALNQAGTVLAVRTVGEHERAAIARWARSKTKSAEQLALMDELPELQQAQAVLWSPGWLRYAGIVHITPKTTFDSSKTPEVGKSALKPKVLAPMDLERLKASMATIVEQAKANDPALLKQEIVKLRAELAKKPAAVAASHPVTTRVEVSVLGAKDRQAIERLANQMEAFYDRTQPLRITAVDVKEKLQGILSKWKGGAGVTTNISRPPSVPVPERLLPKPPPARYAAEVQIVEPDGSPRPIGKGERKMLEAISTRHPTPMSRAQLAALSGFSVTGGTFRTYLPSLKTAGLVEYQGDHVVLTPAGVAVVSDAMAAAPQTTDDVLSQWRRKLRAGELKMFNALVSEYPNTLSRERLGELSGFAVGGGTFRTYLPRLKTLGIVDYSGASEVRASELLFPTGTPA